MKRAMFPFIMATLMTNWVTTKPINDGQPEEYDIHNHPRSIENDVVTSPHEQKMELLFSMAEKRLKSEGINEDDPAYHHLLVTYVMDEYDKKNKGGVKNEKNNI